MILILSSLHGAEDAMHNPPYPLRISQKISVSFSNGDINTFLSLSHLRSLILKEPQDFFSNTEILSGKGNMERVGYETRHEYAYHPQIDGQSERTLSDVEDMLRACVMDFGGSGRKPLEFKVRDRVLLKISLWKGVVRFDKKGKLALRYVGPFEIVERVGPVAYRLKLPQELSCVHDTFHVSNLKKCLAEPEVQVPLDEIEIDEICVVSRAIELWIEMWGKKKAKAEKNPISESLLELSARS
ncbi:hypothetical protein Tco_0839403 [Tanacetum coccineum]|uniref:Tf2-1-like SH3-like domain-containing protein n=1 Tax=Tanacetum coccineum TaxID=301880 RepID=A0ABQ5AQI0_9ASTR